MILIPFLAPHKMIQKDYVPLKVKVFAWTFAYKKLNNNHIVYLSTKKKKTMTSLKKIAKMLFAILMLCHV